MTLCNECAISAKITRSNLFDSLLHPLSAILLIYLIFALMTRDIRMASNANHPNGDPVAANRWRWTFDGAHVPYQPEIPLSNTFGWLLSGMALIAILHQILPRERRKSSASFGAVDIWLAWTLFGGVVSNLFFFDRPGIALVGGLAFGLFFLPYAFSRWLGRP